MHTISSAILISLVILGFAWFSIELLLNRCKLANRNEQCQRVKKRIEIFYWNHYGTAALPEIRVNGIKLPITTITAHSTVDNRKLFELRIGWSGPQVSRSGPQVSWFDFAIQGNFLSEIESVSDFLGEALR